MLVAAGPVFLVVTDDGCYATALEGRSEGRPPARFCRSAKRPSFGRDNGQEGRAAREWEQDDDPLRRRLN